MAQITYRANLSARAFPFLSFNWGRTVMIPQADDTFSRQLASTEDVDKDVGKAQIYYCHNVMPQQQGFQSIGFNQLIGSAGITTFTQRFILRDSAGNKTYLAITSTNDFYILYTGVWTYKATYAVGDVTTAYVNGVTYIYISKVGCYKYDFGTLTFVPVTLTSLDPTLILGITYSAGYLIAWSIVAVAWSSTIDPTDFTPSLVTGAGGGNVESARGTIVACVAHTQGFIVYTEENAVVALFSGNARYPFNFREIVASGGLKHLDQIAFDANSGNHYAYTTSGMQLISTSATQTIFPELTDFIAGRVFEDYDESTDTFSTITLSGEMQKAIAMVSDRYLVVSYGITELTHALVYDLITKRWGKVKVTHVECFEYILPAYGVTEIPRQSLAFLQKAGTVQVVDFSTNSASTSGVICLGKYQYVRARNLQLNEINIENIQAGANFSVYVLSTPDGKNGVRSDPSLLESSGLYRKYGSRAEGVNHSLVMKGSFSITSLELNFNITGKR